MANFVPPIPIGQFRPASESIASWLYQIWEYLQNNPLPEPEDYTAAAEQVVDVNVPPMIATAIENLTYNDMVQSTTLPVYRASNDEIGPEDLLDAWNEGCRFALVDDETFYIMINDNNIVSLFQLLTEAQTSGVTSVNGKTGAVVITSTDIGNASNVQGATISAALNTLNGEIGISILIGSNVSVTDNARYPATGFYPVSGMTANHRVVNWGLSVGDQNNPPADIEVVEEGGGYYFIVTNKTANFSFQPVFALPQNV